mgnify:CR=1 FL=1
MKESHVDEINNLVLFPSAKNYPLESSGAFDPIDDPLEELLNEFSDARDEEFDIEEEVQDECVELAPVRPAKLGQLDRIVLITNQLKTLEETTKKMSFLMDEIENFLPKTKR